MTKTLLALVITLTQGDKKTIVSVFMNRKTSWLKDTPNPIRSIRESAAFANKRKATFNKFLSRLRELSGG
ncbi:MAG: hypothetical protein JKY66_06725 [Spongiibacteraceae bacterium]|nr:hypothetical protein [Spongiibacteraceae bacterium]